MPCEHSFPFHRVCLEAWQCHKRIQYNTLYVCTLAQQPITLWNAPCFPCLAQFRCSADLLGQFANAPATGAAHSRVCLCAPVGKSMSLAESPCAKGARVQQLQLLLQENRRELAQRRQHVARWAAKRGNLGLTSAGQKAVLACYCLSNYNSAIATKLAQQQIFPPVSGRTIGPVSVSRDKPWRAPAAAQ